LLNKNKMFEFIKERVNAKKISAIELEEGNKAYKFEGDTKIKEKVVKILFNVL